MVPSEIEEMEPPTLDQMERHLIALLYAIWRAQGKNKRIVTIAKGRNDECGRIN